MPKQETVDPWLEIYNNYNQDVLKEAHELLWAALFVSKTACCMLWNISWGIDWLFMFWASMLKDWW